MSNQTNWASPTSWVAGPRGWEPAKPETDPYLAQPAASAAPPSPPLFGPEHRLHRRWIYRFVFVFCIAAMMGRVRSEGGDLLATLRVLPMFTYLLGFVLIFVGRARWALIPHRTAACYLFVVSIVLFAGLGVLASEGTG